MLTEELNDKLSETLAICDLHYQFYKEVQMEELNLLPEEVVKLAGIWTKLKAYSLARLAN